MPNENLGAIHTREVRIASGSAILHADLAVPARPRGIVIFAHGSGSSRFSPRNRAVASELQRAGLATLLADLLTREEEARDEITGEFRFDIELLGRRVVDVGKWAETDADTRGLPVGYFGASTGAAAALLAAAARPEQTCAVVSRGGRPDLAGPAISGVRAPTLLIVGGLDTSVLALNRVALRYLPGGSALEVVPGATHLFEEPGRLARVTELARDWFLNHMARATSPAPASASMV